MLPDLWLSRWSSLPQAEQEAGVASNLAALAGLAALAALLVGVQVGAVSAFELRPVALPTTSAISR